MSRPFHAVVFALVATFGIAWCGYALAETGGEFEVGDRVEVERFDNWKAGVVTNVDRRFDRIEVLLDELDLPPELLKHMTEQARLQRRTVTERVDAVRHVTGGSKSPSAETLRTWTSSNGKFSVQATFLRLQDDKVALEREDGKQIEVPIDQLSAADAEYARRAVDSQENPFGDHALVTSEPSTIPSSTPRRANWSNVKTLRPRSFKEWTFKPSSSGMPLVTSNPPTVKLRDIPGSKEFFEGVDLLRISTDGRRAIVGREQGKVGDGQRYVELIDLVKGESEGLIALPEVTALLDADPESGRVVYREDHFGSGKNMELIFAQLHDDKLTTVSSWRPYEEMDFKPSRDIEHAWFLSTDRVMSINSMGKALTVWDVDKAQALINVPVRSSIGLKTAMSPDRTLLAIAMEQGVAIIDLVEGTHRATIECEETGSFVALAFRADNLRLAAAGKGDVLVWDLTTGEHVRTLCHHVINARNGMTWAGEFLLVSNRYLFDANRRILLWDYGPSSERPEATVHQGGRFWFVSKPDSPSGANLLSSAIPHADAVEMADSLGSPDSLLVVKPGTEVKIEVDIHPSVGSSDEVRTTIEENATEAGLVVVEEAPLVLSAICKPQEQQKLRINTGDRFRPQPSDIVERTVTPHSSLLEMKLNGETVYKRGYLAQPGMTIWLEKGESLDDGLKRLTSPNLDVLTKTKIPSELGRPGQASENGAYGASTLSGQPIDSGQRFE